MESYKKYYLMGFQTGISVSALVISVVVLIMRLGL